MGFFDQIRDTFRRMLSGIDGLEETARAGDKQRRARELQRSGAGPQELSGGLEELEELELDLPLEAEDATLSHVDPTIDHEAPTVELELEEDRPSLEALLGPAMQRWEFSAEDTEEVTELAIPAAEISRLTQGADEEHTDFGAALTDEVTEVVGLVELPLLALISEEEPLPTEAGALWTAVEPTLGMDEDLNDDPSEDFGLGSFSWNEEESGGQSSDAQGAARQGDVRFPNSLGLSDAHILEQLRGVHYPELEQASEQSLVELARLDRRILRVAHDLGSAVGELLLSREERWEAACMWSCILLDPALRELWSGRLEQPEAWRRLAWAAWPYLAELLQAAGGSDPFGIAAAQRFAGELLEERRALAEAHPELAPAMSQLPVADSGLYSVQGFEWSS